MRSLFPKDFLFRAHPSDSKNNYESSNHCSRKYRLSGRQVSKFKEVYLKTNFKLIRINTNAQHDLTLINPLNAELNPICCLLALLGAHHFLHVIRIRVKSLSLRLLMSYIYIYIYIYIYMEHPFLMRPLAC